MALSAPPGIRSGTRSYKQTRIPPLCAAPPVAGPGRDRSPTTKKIPDRIRDTVSEPEIEERIAYGRRVLRASWSGDPAHWIVTVQDCESGALATMSCSFLYLCSSQRHYDVGRVPAWPGLKDFTGAVIHPKYWPDDLDITGKEVVVIGDDATAVNLVPTLARTAAHVTMLRWSHPFILSPAHDAITVVLRKSASQARRIQDGALEEHRIGDRVVPRAPTGSDPRPCFDPQGCDQAAAEGFGRRPPFRPAV